MEGSISAANATRMARTTSTRTAPGGDHVCIVTKRGTGLMIVVILTLNVTQRPDAGWDQIISIMEEAVQSAPKKWFPCLELTGRKILPPRWMLVSPCGMTLTGRLWTEVTDWVVVHPPKKGGTVTVVPCGQLIGCSMTSFFILFDFLFCAILASPLFIYMWLCLIVA
jgi:hypothetical protein